MSATIIIITIAIVIITIHIIITIYVTISTIAIIIITIKLIIINRQQNSHNTNVRGPHEYLACQFYICHVHHVCQQHHLNHPHIDHCDHHHLNHQQKREAVSTDETVTPRIWSSSSCITLWQPLKH